MKIRLHFDNLAEPTVIHLLRTGARIISLTHENQSFNFTFEGNESQLEALYIALNDDVGVPVADSFEEFYRIWGV